MSRRSLLCVYLLLVTCTLAEVKRFVNDVNGEQDNYDSDGDVQAIFQRRFKRDRKYCLPWRAPCTHREDLLRKYSFLHCCNNGVCSCNLWGNNCRCEARLG